MKQKGKLWMDAKGASIPEKYITSLQRLQERNGQKIATESKRLEDLLRKAKLEFVRACIEVFRNTPEAEKSRTGFTFYTFDKEFKIEWTIKENYVRVYEATRPNPTSKDYRLMDMNFASIKVDTHTVSKEGEFNKISETSDGESIDGSRATITTRLANATTAENPSPGPHDIGVDFPPSHLEEEDPHPLPQPEPADLPAGEHRDSGREGTLFPG